MPSAERSPNGNGLKLAFVQASQFARQTIVSEKRDVIVIITRVVIGDRQLQRRLAFMHDALAKNRNAA